MNLANLKPGMLIRDTNKLLEVTKVAEHSATAVVVLENLERPRTTAQISYSADGVWSFVASPTDQQLEALAALRAPKEDRLSFADIRELLGMRKGDAAVELEPSPEETEDDELRCGDRVTWIRDGRFTVHGLFWKRVREHCVCVALPSQQKVAMRLSAVVKE